jgi:hypothetical protein
MSDEEISQAHKDAEKRAAFFDAMAAQIRLNKDAKFGGAFVIVSPDLEDPNQMLILDQAEPGVFWAAVQTLAQQAVQAIDALQRRAGFR